jgi:hypothetical protein
MCLRTVRREGFLQPEPDLLKVNPSFPLPDFPNQPRDCYKIIGEDEASLGDAIPYEFVAPNPLNREESRFY